MGLWEKLEWLKLPPVDEQFMSEPLLPYKDNLTYDYGLPAPGTYCSHGMIKNFQKQHVYGRLWYTFGLFPCCVLCH